MDDGEAMIAGSRTPPRFTPCPPSSGVLSTMVASTNVTASVSSANSSPRRRPTRNTTAPMPIPNSAATSAATGSVQRKGMPNWPASVAVVYIPAPKNAPWPNEK